MEFFEFILLIVLITTIGKVVMAVGAPMVDKLGELAKEAAAARRAEREGVSPSFDAELLEELEHRLARIEDRLDFLEELKAPDRRNALGEGRGPDRAPGAETGGIADTRPPRTGRDR